ncbi:MAG TPA: DUF4783 domain-containing protein [Chitinophagaceae bacterium]|jgi:hypothetical protein|nr:DUF4783 domain-containing protein [Chitinophagaceae bacterium]
MSAIITTCRLSKLLLIGGLLMSFTIVDPFTSVVSALQKGNVTALSHYFDNMIEITLPSNANSYSKSQAVVILKEFFSNNAVKSFKLIHKGDSGEGSSFGIGSLVTKGGTYRTTFFFRQKGDSFVLQELSFEKKKSEESKAPVFGSPDKGRLAVN